jgi:DNA-binding transcriptional regulator GbsR (MarR family)
MEYKEARQNFIQAWGTLGSSWGINKAMAQIHALLLVSTEPLSAEEIMEELQMSRGNVNMNLRALIDWGIAKRENKVGERKEYFSTGKDVWELARQVSRERRRREIEPILKVLEEVKTVSGENKKAVGEFRKVTGDLYDFSCKVDGLIEKFTKSDQNWFYKLLMKL